MSDTRGQWTAKVNKHGVLEVEVDITSGPVSVLWTSDWHIDSPECDRRLLRAHLDEVSARDGCFFVVGDLFDVMQGPGDPRSDRNIVRQEATRDGYLNGVLEDATDFVAPYASRLVALMTGNHEKTIEKKYGANLLSLFGTLVRARTKAAWPYVLGTTGYIVFKLKWSTERRRYVVRFHHGSGGAGHATKGVMKANRRASVYECDAHVSGHIHRTWEVPQARVFVNRSGRVEKTTQMHVSLGGYKDPAACGDGWEATNEHEPTVPGAKFMNIERRNRTFNVRWEEA